MNRMNRTTFLSQVCGMEEGAFFHAGLVVQQGGRMV